MTWVCDQCYSAMEVTHEGDNRIVYIVPTVERNGTLMTMMNISTKINLV